MIKMSRHADMALRFYGKDVCVLSHRNGARRAEQGELVNLLFELDRAIGLAGISHIADGSVSLPNETWVFRRRIADFFKDLEDDVPATLNDLVHAAPMLSEIAVRERVPLVGLCELTYRCNLRCQHCYVLHKVSERKPAHTIEADMLQLIDSLVELGCINIGISGGEPTLHKGWRRVLCAAKDAHLYTTLKTNATTFTADRAKIYGEDPAHETHVSLYGSNAATHDAFTAVPGSFVKTIRGMRALASAGVRCKVNCTVWNGNVSELNDISTLVDDCGSYVVFDDIIHGRLNGDLSPVSLSITLDERARLTEAGFLRPFVPSPCGAGKIKLKVDAEGKVSTCELLPQEFGNAFSTPLETIWRDQNLTAYGDRVVKLSVGSDESKCKSGGCSESTGCTTRTCPGLNFLYGDKSLVETMA